jgi:(2R)-3-sulfolactate dehydrogenase (NADP+)
VAVVSVKNSRHAGPMAAYTTRAAAQGCLAIATTNTPPAMRPPGGGRPVFGTNPIAVAAPRDGDSPFSLDMATTAMANGKIAAAAAAGLPLPDGALQGFAGEPVTDPRAQVGPYHSALSGSAPLALLLALKRATEAGGRTGVSWISGTAMR